MNLEDILYAPQPVRTEKWQLGSTFTDDIPENGIALIFCSDYRGVSGGTAEMLDFSGVRQELYRLSALDFELPVCDLGDLISGKNQQDTHYIVQEVISMCYYRNTLPIVVGGSSDLAYALFSALNFHQKDLRYTQISNVISLENSPENLSENNFLSKILTSKNLTLKSYHHLAYQKHLNEKDSVALLKEVDFDVLRLAELMGTTEHAEPFLRRADLVTVNCDAVESRGEPFSVHPQVNGLTNREICAFMKEIGLGEKLRAVGIFNYDARSENKLHHQLLAQMIWYLLEGLNIQRSHPAERRYETFHVLAEQTEYTFKRDTFSGLWYFGAQEKVEDLLPCSQAEYEAAKRGALPARFFNK